MEPTHEQIAIRAHQLWEMGLRDIPTWDADFFWFEALRQLRTHRGQTQ